MEKTTMSATKGLKEKIQLPDNGALMLHVNERSKVSESAGTDKPSFSGAHFVCN